MHYGAESIEFERGADALLQSVSNHSGFDSNDAGQVSIRHKSQASENLVDPHQPALFEIQVGAD
jgi:hypothetical protein